MATGPSTGLPVMEAARLRIERRKVPDVDFAWPDDVSPVLRRVLAARGVTSPGDLDYRVQRLLRPDGLGGIGRACDLLAQAIESNRRVLIVGDYDADGATACALMVRGLRLLGARDVRWRVPDRMRHGYGLTPGLVEEIQADLPALIVTVDNGIASHDGIAKANARGCEVIVTDHHLPAARLPEAAAIVDPNLPGDPFPSKAIAGAGVAFYLLLALRARLFPDASSVHAAHSTVGGKGPRPDFAGLLDLVALGTVADVVPLDANNRILVAAGLRRIRSGKACPGITALCTVAGRDPSRLVASDLGFAIGPRVNAAGRLETIGIGIECLLADDPVRAMDLARQLHEINAMRRELQDGIVGDLDTAIAACVGDSKLGVVLHDASWHPGIVGLVASKVRERLHRPVIAFAGAGTELRGSARSIPGFHVRDALALVDAREPGLILRFGGHAMAAGLSLRPPDVTQFARSFDDATRALIDPATLEPVIFTDGELACGEITLEGAERLAVAGPWGQGFPEPRFENVFRCLEWRRVGADRRHVRMRLEDPRDGSPFDAIQFDCRRDPPGLARVVYAPTVDEWQGRSRLKLRVEYVEPV